MYAQRCINLLSVMARKSAFQPHHHLFLLPAVLLTIALAFSLLPYLFEIHNQTTTDTLHMRNLQVRRTDPAKRNASCTLVACHTPRLPGVDAFWRYYTASPYNVVMYNYTNMDVVQRTPTDTPAHNQWCCVAAAREEHRRHPDTRVVFIDVDTLIDVGEWCNFPMSENGALVINSLHRSGSSEPGGLYVVTGTQIQTNAFAVLPGPAGLGALQRWEGMYRQIPFNEQGIINQLERGVCGVPGWVACKNNPEQQKCHCTGAAVAPGGKAECVDRLFAGMKGGCPIKNTSFALAA